MNNEGRRIDGVNGAVRCTWQRFTLTNPHAYHPYRVIDTHTRPPQPRRLPPAVCVPTAR